MTESKSKTAENSADPLAALQQLEQVLEHLRALERISSQQASLLECADVDALSRLLKERQMHVEALSISPDGSLHVEALLGNCMSGANDAQLEQLGSHVAELQRLLEVVLRRDESLRHQLYQMRDRIGGELKESRAAGVARDAYLHQSAAMPQFADQEA